MNKVIRYLRSMRFGILLLCLIAALSVVGTLIPQDREIAWYAQTYKTFHGTILLLRLNHIYQSWYYVTLLALLCLNLSLCSLTRIRAVVKAARSETERAQKLPDAVLLTQEGIERLRTLLEAQRCRREDAGPVSLYRKHSLGRYGTFVTHLSILLTIVFGALALYTPSVTDLDCMPGESVYMPDGTEIHVSDFRINDESGRLDYQSHVQLTLPDGRRSQLAELKVNHPFSFGGYKLFQQSFGTAGAVTVTDLETGTQDFFIVRPGDGLAIDDGHALIIRMLYPDFLRAPDGEVTLITVTEGYYPNPIYAVVVIADGAQTPVLAEPGQELELVGYRFTFEKPVDYPGLRVKHVSRTVNGLLIAAFALMIAGLYLTFFYEPVVVKVDTEGYAVGGPRPEGMRITLEAELAAYVRKPTDSTKEEPT